MTIDKAIKQLESFCKAYENEEIKKYTMQKYGNIDNVEKDYEATKVLLEAFENYKKVAIELASEIYELESELNKFYKLLEDKNAK